MIATPQLAALVVDGGVGARDDGVRNVLAAPEGHRALYLIGTGGRRARVARCECGFEGPLVQHSAHLAAQRGGS